MASPILSVSDRFTTWPTGLIPAVQLLWSRSLFPGKCPPSRVNSAVVWLTLIAVPAILLYPNLSFHLLDPDEGRYAEIPREMLARGDWVVPHLQGQPYLDKPPLLYWLVMLSFQAFGVSAGAARLVPALAVHLTIIVTYTLGRRVVGDRPAFRGALLLSLMPAMVGMGRLLILDGLLTLWTTLGLYGAFLAVRHPAIGSQRVYWALGAVACGLGVLTKGPVAIILLMVPLFAYRWLHPQLTRPISWKLLAGFLAIVILINLPWYVLICIRRPEFAGYFFWQHNLQRFLSPFDHLEPFWYYIPILLGGLLPAAFWLIPAGRFLLSDEPAAAQRRSPELAYCLLAGGWCVLFFSLSGSKLPTYILPAFPPMALVFGYVLDDGSNRLFGRFRWAVIITWLLGLSLACHVALPWYARVRSPMRDEEVLTKWCGDPAVSIVCYPRNCDSVAFYLGRDDLRSTRSKHVHLLIQDLLSRPRTVVLFTHNHSLEAFRQAVPAQLRVTPVAQFRGAVDNSFLKVFAGDTPWGLCDMAVVENTAVQNP